MTEGKHYIRSTAFWGAVGSLAANVTMLTSVPGTRPSDPIQYEHIVLIAIGFAVLALIGTLLRNSALRGNLPRPARTPRPRPEPLVVEKVEPQNAAGQDDLVLTAEAPPQPQERPN